jgi:hypothetical protein
VATPCPRCGTTKTESVRHGFIYKTLWDMGYHLRRCSFCNRRRLLKRNPNRPHPNDMSPEELSESFNRQIARASGKRYAPPNKGVEQTMTSTSNSSEVPHGDGAPESPTTTAVAEAAGEVQEYRLCPRCGSIRFRRSRRRWYEKLIRRPKMARCLKCDHRFPYPY